MKKHFLKISIGLVIGLLLVWLWLSMVDIAALQDWLTKLQIWPVVAAACLYLLGYFVRALRWRVLSRPFAKINAGRVYLWWMAGNFLNYLIPIRAGELGRAWFVSKHTGAPIAATLPTVFIDKLLDTAAIFLVLLLIPFLPITMSPLMWTLISGIITLVIIGIIVMVLAATKADILNKLILKFLFFLPARWNEKIQAFLVTFIEGVALFAQHRNMLLPVLAYTFLAVLIDSLFFWTMFGAFGVELSFAVVLFGYTLIYLSYILPQPPAQLGSNEVIMVLIFAGGFGMNKEMVSAVMVFSHLLTAGLLSAVGIFAFVFTGTNMFTFFKKEQK